MNHDLLKAFREKINDDGLVLHIFRNKCGKNQWSIICSAMDWIEVMLDGIDMSTLSRNNDNQASIKMATFLSCIDTMWEAVQQLHRVLFDTTEIPFADDYSIFKQHESDNNYFKTIRACFAAHTTNLSKVFTDDEESDRWYASWSGGTFSGKDFSVMLFSNNPDKASRRLDVSFSEIYEFAERRYSYLSVLMEQVDKIVGDYCEDFRNHPIVLGSNILSNIDLLLAENKKRFDSDYYEYELRKMKKAFKTNPPESSKNCFSLQLYRDALAKELYEICNNLQEMELKELKTQVNDDVPCKIHYPFSKLADAVWQDEPCRVFSYIAGEIKEIFADVVDIELSMSAEEIYVLTCAGSYVMNRGENANDEITE